MRWPDEAIVGILWILAALQRLQIWHTLLASAKDHSSGWFLFDLCGRCWIGFGGLIGQGWIWNDMDECDMNVFMLYDFMIFLIFSSHICTKTTINHRLLELLPRFQWETPCTGQGWHCLRQWLKGVRPVRQLSTWIFWGSVHRPTIGIQIHSSDHRHHLRSFPGLQTAKMAISGNARMSHTCHTCHTFGEESAARKPVLYLLSVKSLDCQIRKTTQWSLFRCEELKSACMMHVFTT